MSESVHDAAAYREVEELELESPFRKPVATADTPAGRHNEYVSDELIHPDIDFTGFNRLYADLSTDSINTFKPEVEWLKDDALMGIGCLYHSWSAHVEQYKFDAKTTRDLKCALVEAFCILEDKASEKTDAETAHIRTLVGMKDVTEKTESDIERRIEDIRKLHHTEQCLLDCCNALIYEHFTDDDVRLPWRGSYFPENKGAIISAEDLYEALELDRDAKNYNYRVLVGGGININKATMHQYLSKLLEKHGNKNLVIAHTNLTEAEQVCSKLLKQLNIREEIVSAPNRDLNPLDEDEKEIIENRNRQRAQFNSLSTDTNITEDERKAILKQVENRIIANAREIEDPEEREIYANETFIEQCQDLLERKQLRKLLTADYVNAINEAFKKPIDGIILWDKERQGDRNPDDLRIYPGSDDTAPKYISSAPGAIIIHRALQFNYGDRIWTPAIARQTDKKPFWQSDLPPVSAPKTKTSTFNTESLTKQSQGLRVAAEQDSNGPKSLHDQIRELRLKQKIIVREGIKGITRIATNQIFQQDTVMEYKFNPFLWWLTKRVDNLADYNANKEQERLLYSDNPDTQAQLEINYDTEEVDWDDVDAAEFYDDIPDTENELSASNVSELPTTEKLNHLVNELKATYEMKTGHKFKLPYQAPGGTLLQGIPVLLASRTIPDKETIRESIDSIARRYNNPIIIHTNSSRADEFIKECIAEKELKTLEFHYDHDHRRAADVHSEMLDLNPVEIHLFGENDFIRDIRKQAAARGIAQAIHQDKSEARDL